MENILFGSEKSICLEPMMHSFATTPYCTDNTIPLTSWFSIHLSYNTGIAFSVPIRGLLLQGITILLIIAIGWQYLRIEYPKKSKLLDIGYISILA